jgi:uroporphyrin-III C-methyltransferase/precorrin-2 dehydrogenase/sirohydrochlorin ferrochelatase
MPLSGLFAFMRDLLPLFLKLTGRDVVVVGGGRVAAAKLQALVDAGARIRVIAPKVAAEIDRPGVDVVKRSFMPSDLDGAWLVVAAATPEVNRQVAVAAEARRIFVNAVDDPENASAFLSGTLRRDGVTIAISTSGDAPALTSLLREGLDATLPADLDAWMTQAREQRTRWRRHAVPMSERKPKLLEAINKLYASTTERPTPAENANESAGAGSSAAPRAGHVSLVGAGPGDPALLTRKAIARLRAADLVLFDALIDDRILRYARKAQRFFAGKRGAGEGAPGQRDQTRVSPMTQPTINNVMIRAARRGRRVVRLKGGDPFVFGRGGEEARALREAGVPFDIVPGVTSAFAAPVLAGIPITYRGVSSAVLVVPGHDMASFGSSLASLRPNGVTLIVLMGGTHAAEIAQALTRCGWSPATPAALVTNASKENQQVWRGTLDQLSAAGGTGPSGPGDLDGPVTIIIGDVVALSTAGQAAGLERLYVTGT